MELNDRPLIGDRHSGWGTQDYRSEGGNEEGAAAVRVLSALPAFLRQPSKETGRMVSSPSRMRPGCVMTGSRCRPPPVSRGNTPLLAQAAEPEQGHEQPRQSCRSASTSMSASSHMKGEPHSEKRIPPMNAKTKSWQKRGQILRPRGGRGNRGGCVNPSSVICHAPFSSPSTNCHVSFLLPRHSRSELVVGRVLSPFRYS